VTAVAAAARGNGRLQDVLAAAVDTFSSKGYRATSMRDIADAVGLSKPALYYYVTSKEELLVQLYEHVLDANLAAARRIAADTEDPMTALRSVLVDRIRYTCENRRLLQIFFEEEAELPARLTRKVRNQRRRYEDALIELLARAAERGEARLDAPPRLVVNSLLGAANWTYKWYDAAGPLSPTALGETLADILLRMVREPS